METTLVKKSEALEKFGVVKEQLAALVESCYKLRVTDTTTLGISEQKLTECVQTAKVIEDKRKEIKEPFLQAGKDIDSIAKELSEPLLKAIAILKESQLEYQNKLASEVGDYVQSRIEAIKIAYNAKHEELDLIRRVFNKQHARIYGGTFVDNKGEAIKCDCAKSVADLNDIASAKYPPEEKFVNFRDLYTRIVRTIDSFIEEATEYVEKGRISELIELGKSSEDIGPKIINIEKQKLVKEEDTEIKKVEKTIKEATKGIRETLDYELVDITKVPIEYLEINDKKVKNHIASHKDEIKDGSTEFDIPGINFITKQSKVAGR